MPKSEIAAVIAYKYGANKVLHEFNENGMHRLVLQIGVSLREVGPWTIYEGVARVPAIGMSIGTDFLAHTDYFGEACFIALPLERV